MFQPVEATLDQQTKAVVINERSCETGEQSTYADSFEHLQDELRGLDLLIRLRVLEQRDRHPSTVLDQFKGLVLWDEEIDRLLSEQIVSSNCGDERKALVARLEQLESQIRQRREASRARGVFLALPDLSRMFNLSSFEEKCVLICLAPEVDRKYERLFAYLHDDVTRKKPSVDLVLNLLCHSTKERIEARCAFDSQAPLGEHRIVQLLDDPLDAPSTLLGRVVKLDDRIAGWLLGSRAIDARLESVATLVLPDNASRETHDSGIRRGLRDSLRSHFAGDDSRKRKAALHFCGRYGSGRRKMAECLSGDFELLLIVADAQRMIEDAASFQEKVELLVRECLLQPTALAVENFDSLLGDNDSRKSQLTCLLDMIRSAPRLTFLLGAKFWMPKRLSTDLLMISCEFPVPSDRERHRIWKGVFDGYSHRITDADLALLASKFRFTAGQIEDAVVAAHHLATWRSPDSQAIELSDIYAACRVQSVSKLGDLARKIEPHYTWNDIVLPADQLAQLKEMCEQVKTRRIVFGEWGFDRKLSLGKGLNALFAGSPGTGKTMAAEVIASELGLYLYRIDLSQVVSKYIGETEKNLNQIFEEAETSNAILFFDEADALFGKRSEVKDSHDRYANIEIGYLLQKMEEYDGIAILATNLRQNLDDAFTRRLQIIVEFPFPDEHHRKLIWQVTFPKEAPLDSKLNFSFLAREIKLAGGNIKNIAVTAAFYAASDGGVIRMPHLEEATRREYQKLGWPWSEADWDRQSMYFS